LIPHEFGSKLDRSISQGFNSNKSLLLNPGPSYLLEPTDLCFYISLVKEENYNWKEARLADCILDFLLL